LVWAAAFAGAKPHFGANRDVYLTGGNNTLTR